MFAQLILLREFISMEVQEGQTELSAVFVDFSNAIDFLVNLEYKELLIDGENYIKDVRIETIQNNLYQYPTKGEGKSQYTCYDIFKAGGTE